MREFFKKFKEMPITYPVTVMVVICLVITAALAGTDMLTSKKISAINEKNEKAAMAELIPADKYETQSIKSGSETYTYSTAYKNGKLAGYIFNLSEKGYGGTVSVMVAVNPSGEVGAVRVLDVSNETPGLGQNTAKEEFLKQFKGKSSKITAVKYGTASGDDEIDAVASATITSKAVTSAVNKAIDLTASVKELSAAANVDVASANEKEGKAQ